MSTEPEKQEKVEKPNQQQDNTSEEIAKQIPTVTPDQDNLEPVPDEENKK